jgi:hypothetical protein
MKKKYTSNRRTAVAQSIERIDSKLATSWKSEESALSCRKVREIISFSAAFRPAQSPKTGLFSNKGVELNLHPSLRLHSVALNLAER